MSDSKGNNQVYSPSFLKLAQLYTAITQHFHIEEVDGILENAGNINYRFPANSCLTTHHPELVGSTMLHLAINFKDLDLNIFELLLNYGADYTLKNKKGSTALLQAVETIFYKSRNLWKRKSKLANEYISEILSRQVRSQNPANPCSSDGMSHFHVACMINHQEAVSFFLENGTPVDQSVSMSSLYFPGYTALHFAVRFCAVETIEVLLRFHATLDIQDARGMTPMHVALERKMEIADLIKLGAKKLLVHMLEYETIMKQLLQSNKSVDSIGLTNFHVTCTMKDTSLANEYLDQIEDIDHFVKLDSPVWPGYTALHFAALFNVEIVQMLIQNGANIAAKDADGISPFDICLKSYKLKDIHSILSKHPILKSSLFSDGRTRLSKVIMDMNRKDNRVIIGNMNIFVPLNSPVWPGYTPLHIAVVFAERITDTSNYEYYCEGRKRVKMFEPAPINDEYLAKGVNLTVQDANGSTPLHLAFRLQRFEVVERFITQNRNDIANSVDSHNLSHLHIAAAMGDVELITKLLKSGAVVDMQVHATFKCTKPGDSYSRKSVSFVIPKGSTALHIAVARDSYKTISALLKYSASVYVRDANGMTPIHRQIATRKRMDETEQLMLNLPELKNCIHKKSNLSHLHVASLLGDKEVVKRLLDQGADVNAVVKCVDPSDESLRLLAPYDGFTPLHFAWKNDNDGVFELLIERGADIFARSAKGIPLFYEHVTSGMVYSMLEESEDLRRRMFEDTGLTMLHLVCARLDREFENFGQWSGLDDINARSRDDSPVWPGCTPLDVFVRNFEKYDKRSEDVDPEYTEEPMHLDVLFEYGFLENGADVTLVNGSKTTALLEFDRLNRAFKEEIVYDNESDESDDWPMFHYDSSREEELREKKIKVKCTWNKSSRQEDEKIPSSEPLSLLFQAHRDFAVDPVNAKGMSHFHVACLYKYDDVVKQFLKHTVDINSAVSLFSDEFPGCTPLHLTMIHRVVPKITQLLLDHGADVHARDVYGNTPLHFAAKKLKEYLKCSRDIYGDNRSRFSAKDFKKYEELLLMIINKGADVNARNSFGETPLDILLNSYLSPNTSVVELFLKNDYCVNSFNPISQESWLPKAFSTSTSHNDHENSKIYTAIMNAPNLTIIDDFGRTPIHNLSSYCHTPEEGIRLLKALEKQGCNVHQRDTIGRSALHIAVQFANVKAVTELLKLGADINLEDSIGKVPFAYCFEASTLEALRRSFNSSHSNKGSYEKIKQIFSTHIRKLQLVGLDVSENNLVAQKNFDQTTVVDFNSFSDQLVGLKRIQIQCDKFSIELYDLLSETKIVAAYPNMLRTKQQAINNFFESGDFYKVCEKQDELFGFLKLQYKKAVERGSLIKDVEECLNILADLKLPYLISQMIIKQLSNLDLKNLKASVKEELLR